QAPTPRFIRERGAQSIRMTQNTNTQSSNGHRPLSYRYIRFGPFEVDGEKETVTKDGCRLKLGGKAFEIFQLLLETPDKIVTREAICERLWPCSSVDADANLTTTVNKLRRTIGDSCYNPAYIQTIPRKGYALLGKPEFCDGPKQSG